MMSRPLKNVCGVAAMIWIYRNVYVHLTCIKKSIKHTHKEQERQKKSTKGLYNALGKIFI